MGDRIISNFFCGLDEIAKALRMNPQTVREWIEDGMPCYLVGNRWLANLDELWDWIKKNKAGKKCVK